MYFQYNIQKSEDTFVQFWHHFWKHFQTDQTMINKKSNKYQSVHAEMAKKISLLRA